jgi:cardiolipin synthase
MHILNWASISFSILLSITTAGHALLHQRSPSSALGWVAVCLVFPFMGPCLYFLFGVNRVETRAKKLEDRRPASLISLLDYEKAAHIASVPPSSLNFPSRFSAIARISDKVAGVPLLAGNRVKILHNGESAYPSMISAIQSAKKTLYLTTYIFDTTPAGKHFISALAGAVQRGVDVRVIIDGFGELYSMTRAGTKLKKAGVRVARFLAPQLIPPSLHINLRNHRKILIADGHTAYTGGINISDRHLAATHRKSRIVDIHFRLTGPIVMQLEQVFLEDWTFCTGEQTEPTPSLPVQSGNVLCRAITDGPNEDVNKLSTILIGAISSARERILIMTPYFLPSAEMISALKTAAIRGIDIQIVLPQKNNLPFVQWASNNMLFELIFWGVRIYFQPPPFVHSKLFLLDDHYTQIGSANLDPRSLRLNFELNVEIYDREVTTILATHMEDTIGRSKKITLGEIENRPLLMKIRDAIMWLFSPYL